LFIFQFYIGAKGGKGEFVLRVKLQIQFLLIDVMIMGLKLSPSNTNKRGKPYLQRNYYLKGH
jgi:hypothetical protein